MAENTTIVEYLRILEKGLNAKGRPACAKIALDARIEIERLRSVRVISRPET